MEQTVNDTVRARPRLVGLDLLRLLAIMLVLGRHMRPPPATLSGGWSSILLSWQRGGWVGVDLFFVLSGFLISGLLFAESKSRGRLSIARFYTRRGWKIYPPFFALIAITMIVNLIHGWPVVRWRVFTWPLASELMFLQSYLPGLWNHTWSLAVEEHFYVLLPLVLLLVGRLNRGSSTPFKPVLSLAAGVAVLTLLLRLLNWYYRPVYSHLTHLFASHLRFDSLFFGVAISYAYHFHTKRFIESVSPWRRWLMVGGTLLLTPAFVFQLEATPFIYTVGLTLLFVGSGMLLVGILLCNFPRSRLVVFMATLGAYSYSIYLWHMPVNDWGVKLVERACGVSLGFGVRAAVYLIGSLAIGVVMAKILEMPALRLRDRLFPPNTAGAIENHPPAGAGEAAKPSPQLI